MASTTSDSLPSSSDLPAGNPTSTLHDQDFSSHPLLHLPSSSSTSPYLLSFPTTPPLRPPPPTPPPPPPPPPTTVKPPKKRPRASRRPPTTVLTTDTSNFRAMVQEFTGFPAPPFATAQPPTVRPRLLAAAPPFLLRPSPLKFPHVPPPPPPCTTDSTTSTSSLVDALALFAKGSLIPSSTSGSSAHDDYHDAMGGFNPFEDFEAAAVAEGKKVCHSAGDGFFSSLGPSGDKYDRH